MTLNDIETALGQRLATMTPAPVVAWPNKDAPGTPPYVEFQHEPNVRLDNSVDCSGGYQLGFLLLTVVVARDGYTGDALTRANALALRYPYGLRLTAGSGTVLIYKPPDIVRGFTDGVYWRQPVRISYRTEE